MVDAKLLFLIAIFFLGFSAFHQRKRKKILMFLFAASCTLCMLYLLGGALVGVIISFIGAARNIVYAHRESHRLFKLKVIPYAFSMCVVALGVLIWNGPITLLFVVGNVVSCFGLNRRRTTHMRISVLISSPLLAVYEFLAGSFIGVCYELVLVVSSVWGLIKYRRNRHHTHHSHR